MASVKLEDVASELAGKAVDLEGFVCAGSSAGPWFHMKIRRTWMSVLLFRGIKTQSDLEAEGWQPGIAAPMREPVATPPQDGDHFVVRRDPAGLLTLEKIEGRLPL